MNKKTGILSALLLLFTVSFAQTDSNPLWMRYPALSPDGEQIAFTYKGNLFTVSSSGGEAQLLTAHPAYDFMPVWSPDSKTIAFASNRHGNFDVYTISANGGKPKRLTYHSANEYPTTFTPDGKSVLFKACIQDDAHNILFPTAVLPELYSVPANGGRTVQVLTTPAENATFDPTGKLLTYTDKKGYEDSWRKHHKSSVTRDIWVYNTVTGEHTRITGFEGEDRNSVFSPDGESLYYLTEQFGSFNVARINLNSKSVEPVSHFDKHPVRFLSIDKQGKLCYQYNGELYTQKPGMDPQKVAIRIAIDQTDDPVKFQSVRGNATEMAVSPDGKEIALVIRGDIFVTSTDYSTTKRITNTPEQERSVSFSPDGKKLLYASERNGSWNVYQTTRVIDSEPNFALSTILKEEPVVEIPEEAFQPAYSPDGKEVAFIKERTTLCVINLATKKIRTILDGSHNYSYSDGDQWYQWSPDGKWFVVTFMETPAWPDSDIGIVKADGSGEYHNITQSGYQDSHPKWAMNGKAIIWFNDKQGMRSHGSWGSQFDVYAVFLTQEAFDEFKLSKQEYELLKERKKKEKENAEKTKSSKSKKREKTKKTNDKVKLPEVKIDFDNIEDRKVRLTINSSSISDAYLMPEGDKLYYLCRFEKGYDLWVHKLREKETKLLIKIKSYARDLQTDKKHKFLFVLSNGTPKKIEIAKNKITPVRFEAQFEVNYPKEREYMFEHMWRQVLKKFYDPNLHGVDWEGLKKNYSRFLPHITNNFDFAEMMSELLGELNASHTGCRYRPNLRDADKTATLGALYDLTYTGKGIKIVKILPGSPLRSAKSKITPGCIIEKIDGKTINESTDYFHLLNRKNGQYTLLSVYNPKTDKRWEETIKPISNYIQSELIYKNWVREQNARVEKLSNGRIGYVHVRGMNSQSYREVYSQLLGKHRDKEAVIVDTRFNGGGWLHDDLTTLLSGKKYADFAPRGQYIGTEPISKWKKPSVVLVSEGNYSDAHGFPYVYKTLKIGKLIGMPVPGTMTAVWWEKQIDPTLVFGIPQMGVKDLNGNYLENHQLEPDIKVSIPPEKAAKGIDTQLEAAVNELLKELNNL